MSLQLCSFESQPAQFVIGTRVEQLKLISTQEYEANLWQFLAYDSEKSLVPAVAMT